MKAVAGYRVGGEEHVVTAHTCADDSTDSSSNPYGLVSANDSLYTSILYD